MVAFSNANTIRIRRIPDIKDAHPYNHEDVGYQQCVEPWLCFTKIHCIIFFVSGFAQCTHFMSCINRFCLCLGPVRYLKLALISFFDSHATFDAKNIQCIRLSTERLWIRVRKTTCIKSNCNTTTILLWTRIPCSMSHYLIFFDTGLCISISISISMEFPYISNIRCKKISTQSTSIHQNIWVNKIFESQSHKFYLYFECSPHPVKWQRTSFFFFL